MLCRSIRDTRASLEFSCLWQSVSLAPRSRDVKHSKRPSTFCFHSAVLVEPTTHASLTPPLRHRPPRSAGWTDNLRRGWDGFVGGFLSDGDYYSLRVFENDYFSFYTRWSFQFRSAFLDLLDRRAVSSPLVGKPWSTLLGLWWTLLGTQSCLF